MVRRFANQYKLDPLHLSREIQSEREEKGSRGRLTCVSQFGSSRSRQPSFPTPVCNTLAPTTFFSFGSTPFNIPHPKPSATRFVQSASPILPLSPKTRWTSLGAPPICRHRLKKSSADRSAASMNLCMTTGSWRVSAWSAPAR